MRYPSLTQFLLILQVSVWSVTARGSISIEYFAVRPSQNLYYFEELPPKEEDGLILRSVDGNLIGDRLKVLSAHPSGGVEILTWLKTDETWRMDHVDIDGRVSSSVVIQRQDFEEMLNGHSTPIFAATSPDRKWIAWVETKGRVAPQTGYTLRVSELVGNEIDHESSPLEIEIIGGFQEYVETQVSWDTENPSLYYTDTSERIFCLNPESGVGVEVTEGVFCGLVPRTKKLFVRKGKNDLVLFDTLTGLSQSLQVPIKLSNENFYSIYPLPRGEKILYVTPRFHLLEENATNLWTANLDGSDLTKIGKSRDSIRDFRFVD